MKTAIKKTLRELFSVEAFTRFTDKVSSVGAALPLLHFAALPFSLFAFVHQSIFMGKRTNDFSSGMVSFEVPVDAITGFYWLVQFWSLAACAAACGAAAYLTMRKSFAKNRTAWVASKALFAVFVTSGTVERLLATQAMTIPVSYAPKFGYSFYHDLGDLVRSASWDWGAHSWFAKYTWLPLVGLVLVVAAHVVGRIVSGFRAGYAQDPAGRAAEQEVDPSGDDITR